MGVVDQFRSLCTFHLLVSVTSVLRNESHDYPNVAYQVVAGHLYDLESHDYPNVAYQVVAGHLYDLESHDYPNVAYQVVAGHVHNQGTIQ